MQFKSFKAFYPYYLAEHSDPKCRAMHYVGSTLVLLVVVLAAMHHLAWLLLAPVIGYGFAWIGHFGFEHNRPATFKHPWYSLMGDWVMYKDFLAGMLGLPQSQAARRHFNRESRRRRAQS